MPVAKVELRVEQNSQFFCYQLQIWKAGTSVSGGALGEVERDACETGIH
jgi:hypothetical protein